MEIRRRLGIPYARAERFRAPEPLPFDADAGGSAFGPAVPQPVGGPLGELVPGMAVGAADEHACLTLNVWAPPGASDLPVLVWFHGGSFLIGASSQPVYDGALLATEQSVVVVSVNYRLGALGFLDARPFGGVANCGARDALCALQWVQQHIASFGGDPARVVAFGESAGGGLVAHVLTSPSVRGLLAGAIVQSGATFSTLDDERAAVVAETLAKEAAVDDLSALATLPVDALVDAQSRAMGSLLGPIGMLPFHPMVDGDVVLTRPTERLAVEIPVVCGTTSDEMALFVNRSAPPPERAGLEKRLGRYLGGADGRAVVAAYERALRTSDTGVIWRAIFGDREMQVPARALLDAHTGPAYTYCFTWEGPEVGACHAIDIPFTFGNFVDGWDGFVGLDDDARALSRCMRDAWAAFARTGDPGWSAYPNAMIFGPDTRVEPAHPLFVRSRALEKR